MADIVGKLVAVEYRTEKYNQETRQQEPCTPHYVFKYELPPQQDGKKFAYIRQYDTPKTQQFLTKFKNETGLGVVMDALNNTQHSLYQKQDNPNYPPSWNISTRPAVPPAPAPAPAPEHYPPQSAGPPAGYHANGAPNWSEPDPYGEDNLGF